MITVSEAREKITANCPIAKIIQLPLHKAGGYVLAETLVAPIDTPHFDQSAMDGYAFSFSDWDGMSDLVLAGEIQTGNHFKGSLKPMKALRIFTGAALPSCADTVVIQENVIKDDNRITIKDSKLYKGSNIRLRGSQTKQGELVLKAGHLLTPASVTFLAGLGIEAVNVYSNPSVSIIATGKELIKPGEALSEGRIFESNSFGLKAALEQMNISLVTTEMVDDDEALIIRAIKRRLNSDILILTGGVSVGDYDFVATALEKCEVKKVFHKVKQKPGKPFYFGKHQQTLVFGLPGNPASVLICFYEYVSVAIGHLTKKEYFKKIELPLANDFSKKKGLTFLLKGKANGNKVSILNDQESYKMNSFAEADCLIELEEAKEQFEKGDLVNVRMIV